jgi:hypothetical protein
MSVQTLQPLPPSRFVRSRPGWLYVVRRYEFIILTLVLLVGYAVFLLPNADTTPVPRWILIGVFILLVLAWSANILADGDKPDWLKGLVAIGLIATLCWLFYRYSGT